ncbi:phage integrase N-terminal SAM-like domain-containing protein [Chelatococcus sp.]|uniref:phage integrase N-terminal SAM-like domain-containing protein n=1 Tax=Chelatococcus sp. TaxID=1953771 RepID=UPI0025C16CAA|nr:phage integrase N-terminal SAM-like domain-containing protein [Chelatococcus sp.]
MNHPVPDAPISPLRQRLIDDMNMRRFSGETQRNYLRDIGRLATFLGRSPDTATADDLRRFQIEQQEDGVPVPTMNSIVSALRFFFTQTLDRPDPARRLVRLAHPRKLPVVLSRDEVARVLNAMAINFFYRKVPRERSEIIGLFMLAWKRSYRSQPLDLSLISARRRIKKGSSKVR